MTTPTYVLTLPLKVEIWQEHILEKCLNIGRTIYNACLGEALSRYEFMKRHEDYKKAAQQKKDRNETVFSSI